MFRDQASPARPPGQRLMGLQILATGSAVPDAIVTNEHLRQRFGLAPDEIVQHSGVQERRHVPDSKATSDLCVEASQRCLRKANVAPESVDLVLVATSTPDMSFPSVACMVQDRLKLNGAAVDLQVGCAGFVYALVTGASYLLSGASDLCLVVGADCLSRVIHPGDFQSFALLGDGAGAVLLARGQAGQGLLGYHLGASGNGGDLFCRPGCGSRLPPSDELLTQGLQFLHLDEPGLSYRGGTILTKSIRQVLDSCHLLARDIDLFLAPQVKGIVHALAENLQVDLDRFYLNLNRYGNTSAGAVPLALDEACKDQRVKAGSRIMMNSFGSGLAWGSILFSW